MEPKITPLMDEHKRLGAKLAPFGGWRMPIQYSGIIAEHNWTRTACSLFDICHMGEFIIYGEPSHSNLEKIITVNLSKMPCNGCRYGFMLNEEGGIIDDVVVYRIKNDQWMLVVNSAVIDSDEAHLKKYLSKDSKLENLSEGLGKLDLQGPLSKDILRGIVGEEIDRLKYYRFDFFPVLGERIIISRTGYTGELGYEIYISNENINALWNLLLENEKVKPAGLGARDTLRLEMCYPLYGQDISVDVTPLEAGLERFVDFSKDFIGKEALVKKKKNGLTKQIAYFTAESRRAPRHNYKIETEGREVGIVTSGSFSPSLSRGIGMGYIEPAYNKLGARVTLKAGKKIIRTAIPLPRDHVLITGNLEIKAALARKPFYKEGSIKRGLGNS